MCFSSGYISTGKKWAVSAGSDFYELGILAFVCFWWKCIANGNDYKEK